MSVHSGPFGRRLAVLAAWLLAVGLGSALTWVAVDRAGRAVLDPAPLTRAADVLPDGATPATADPTAVPSPSPPSASPQTGAPVATGGHGGGSGGGQGGTSGPGGGDAGTSGGGSGSSSGSGGAPAPAPAQQSGTRSTEGGTVAVSCSGGAVSLRYATPAAGWSAEARDTGPDEVRVRFKRGDRSGESELDVRARCSGGTPSFSTHD